jgi:hypothetical protein
VAVGERPNQISAHDDVESPRGVIGGPESGSSRFDVLSTPAAQGEHCCQSPCAEETVVSESSPEPNSQGDTSKTSVWWADGVGRVGVDWWATIVAGVITVLAATDLLPKIPW